VEALAEARSRVDELEALRTIGAWSAVIAVVLTLLWLIILIRSPDPGSAADEQVAFYGAQGSLLIRQFLPTTLVAFCYVPVWLGLAVDVWDSAAALALVAAAFGLLYPPVVAMAYWSQYTVARSVAEACDDDPAAAARIWAIIGFSEDPRSVPGSLVVLGYFIWGIAGALFAVALMENGGGVRPAAAGALGLTAALTTTGAIGVVWRNRVLTRAVLASGATSVVATGLVAAVLFG
jgi:hypothetical protein